VSEQNRTIYRDHFEVLWNAKRGDQLERFIAPNYQGVDVEEVVAGSRGYKQHFLALTTAFPDVVITIHAILADQDVVSPRYVVESTHRGDFAGLPPRDTECSGRAIRRSDGGWADCRGARESGFTWAAATARRHFAACEGPSSDLPRLMGRRRVSHSSEADVTAGAESMRRRPSLDVS
jgi:predicted ester cyclase